MEATLEIPNLVGCCSATVPPATSSRLEFAMITPLVRSANLHETKTQLSETRTAARIGHRSELSTRSKPNSTLHAPETNQNSAHQSLAPVDWKEPVKKLHLISRVTILTQELQLLIEPASREPRLRWQATPLRVVIHTASILK